MDTNKMRAEFEAAFVEEEVRLLGEGFRSSALHMLEQNTVNVRSAWWAWQASSEAVVVELPNRKEGKYCSLRGFDEVRFCADVRAAIEAQGLKVSP
ncbi:hypothetical protein MF6396_03075 [Pseudomonas sp. MF6396]|uniref:hypothetical protein n=1 Tax=Pseudomonas sp. MF6396 TaxID=1960828 RepID=UPI000996CBDB|nr:hypothetical protein [Pseudomonas sp. MF6396]OOW06645.1 hypothetical protein MF6396_03075 [Pseudomonas sp. MF6396]